MHRLFSVVTSLRAWFLLALCLTAGLMPSTAHATHFRYGNMNWHPTSVPGQVQFDVTLAFKREFFSGTAPDGFPQLGDIVSVGTFNYGEGAGGGFGDQIQMIVTSYSITEDYIIGQALNPRTTNPGVLHTYSGTGPFTASLSSCCRLNELNNRSFAGYNLETIVTPTNANNSPVSTLVPVIRVQVQANASFTVPAYDPDGDPIRFRLATDEEATGSTFPDPSPPGLAINPITGTVTWDTTTLDQVNFWTVQVMVEDLDANGVVKSKIPVDFLLLIRPQVGSLPTVSFSRPSPISSAPGSLITFTITGSDPDAGDTVTLNTGGLPLGATINPSLPATGASPVTGVFTWTPTLGQNGTHLIAFTATDGDGQQDLKIMQINISDNFLQLDSPTYSVVENAGRLSVNVVMSPAATRQTSVTLSTSDGTAISAADFSSVRQVVTFLVGESTKTVTIPILNDTATEPAETFNLRLSNQTNGIALGSNATAVATIIDDDVTLPPPGPLVGRIAFMSQRDGNHEIYIMNANGSSQTRLTNNVADDDYPNFSPDGRLIAFTTKRNGNFEIYTMRNDGTQLTRLTTDVGIDTMPQFSPDGRRIVFSSNRAGNFDIWVMNADGTGQTRLTTAVTTDDHPSFTADGSKIAFHAARGGNHDIWIMNADGTGQTRLTTSAGTDTYPTCSRSTTNNYIAFQSERTAGQFDIYIMNVDGTNQRRVTTASTIETLPCFSPDGTRFAFASTRGGGDNEICHNSLQGEPRGVTTQVTANYAADLQPTWALVPSGNFSAISANQSDVELSSATASVLGASVALEFTGPLNAEAASYLVEVNGKAVAVESASANGASIKLKLAGTLRKGDVVTVSWQGLLDEDGASVAGSSGALTAK